MENHDRERDELTGSEKSSYERDGRDIFERTAHYDPLSKKDDPQPTDKGETPADDIKIKSPLLAKLENFFYHYKWHTLIATFFVFIIALCIFQTCKRTSYDGYVLYAGGKNLRTMEAEETESTYAILYKAMGIYVSDCNDDGERNLSMLDIYLPSADEIKKLEEESNVPYNLLNENDELFRNNMLSGNYYVCMISEYLFEQWTKENNPFVPVRSYLPEDAKIASAENAQEYRLASDYGVYLSSTPLKDKPGFSYMPEDTVICLKKYSKSATPGKKGKAIYQNSEKLFRALLKGETYE